MEMKVNPSQIIQGGLAALVAWLFRTVQQLTNEVAVLKAEVVNANDLILQDKNKFSGWNCWAGLHGVNIDMWGNMYRADCQFGGAIGNLERYKLPKEKILCGKERCSCLSDIYIRKENEKV